MIITTFWHLEVISSYSNSKKWPLNVYVVQKNTSYGKTNQFWQGLIAYEKSNMENCIYALTY